MPILRPLRALRYGRDHSSFLDELISPAVRGEPSDRTIVGDVHPWNVRQLVRGDRGPLAQEDDPPFTHASRLLGSWKQDGIVARDARPALYVYEQRFGEQFRRGVVGLVRLDPEGSPRLLPHEFSRGGSAETLAAQLAATRCQFSLVMAISPDRRGILADYLDRHPGRNDIEVHDGKGHQNRIWRDEDPAHHVELNDALRDEHAVIADGHHRVEAAMKYQAACAGGQPVTRERPYDYVMTLLVPASQPGLISRPTHRVCEALGTGGRAFLDDLDQRFSITSLERDALPQWFEEPGIRFALARKGGIVGLELRPDAPSVRQALATLPGALASVEPAVLSATVLDPLALAEIGDAWNGDGADTGGAASNSSFSHNRTSATEVIDSALAGTVDAAFLLRPVPNDQVLAVAEEGLLMPAKSTNFYPKPIKGLLMNSLVSF
ncbi:MAG: DUF1015 domain-containing protein [Deltaproteobacteria bacterium]|nr:DUF1015 domain-containing protein [Deltaproteobacteria bacterium]